ncbi:MAG: helix-turn-helix domain-containing protein [Clostridiales bacterium]|nr:helix-turn-helix domain-containing protein [Clostridiales bacterium]
MLYRQIKTLCAAKGISIAKLERECDLGNATVRRWENEDRSPSLESVRRVADYFGVSVDFLLGRTTNAEQ